MLGEAKLIQSLSKTEELSAEVCGGTLADIINPVVLALCLLTRQRPKLLQTP